MFLKKRVVKWTTMFNRAHVASWQATAIAGQGQPFVSKLHGHGLHLYTFDGRVADATTAKRAIEEVSTVVTEFFFIRTPSSKPVRIRNPP
jgi:hypothetical protein